MAVDKFIEVVTCIILCKNENKLQALILKRSSTETEGPRLWTVPGGKVERCDWGEKKPTANTPVFEGVLDRAAIREVRGETGIEISADGIITMQKKALIFVRRDGKTPTMVHRLWTFCERLPYVLLSSEAEVTDYAWVYRTELTRYEFIGNVREDIEIAMRECVIKNPTLHM